MIGWIFAALLVVALIITIVWFRKEQQRDRIYIQTKIRDLDSANQHIAELSADYTQALAEKNLLTSTIGDLKLKIQEIESQDDKSLSILVTQISAATSQLDTLTKDIEAASFRKSKLEEEYAARQTTLAGELQSINDSRATLLEDQNRLQEAILAATQMIDALHNQKQALEEELKELCERHRVALLSNWQDVGELGIRFTTTEKETQLVAAIKDICELYPELGRELKKIEWEKVWRPKVQVYRSELAAKQGIYKLTLADDYDVCYIGQARNVYERWFEHMKKMIGVEAKGNEKLYEYGIGDFYWKFLEEVEDASKLNDAEKYWIDYLGCTELGLNKKR